MAAADPDATDWLGACRRSVDAIRDDARRAPDDRRARAGDRHARRGRRPDAADRRGGRGRRVRRARGACTPRGARFTAVSEERGVVDFGSPRPARGDRPDRRLAQRQARAAALRAVDRGRRRRRRWPTSCSASCTTSGPRRSGSPGAARGAQLDGVPAGPDARRAPHARRQARGARRRVGRPALGRAVRRRAGRDRAPAARDRRDRRLALPGRGRALRRDGVAEALPRGRRRRRAADRARGGRAWSRSSPTRTRWPRRWTSSRARR